MQNDDSLLILKSSSIRHQPFKYASIRSNQFLNVHVSMAGWKNRLMQSTVLRPWGLFERWWGENMLYPKFLCHFCSYSRGYMTIIDGSYCRTDSVTRSRVHFLNPVIACNVMQWEYFILHLRSHMMNYLCFSFYMVCKEIYWSTLIRDHAFIHLLIWK